MASLKTNVGSLEDEKISLLTVIKVLQTDADPSQPANTDNHNVNDWKRVNGRIVSEKRGESVNKNDTVINNQFEVLSDSDIEIKLQETPFDKKRQKAININKSHEQSNKDDKYVERQSKDCASPSKTKVPNTVIIGDSMTKHLDC